MTERPSAGPLPAAGAPRRVAIDPLTRVEGHGKVTILLDGEGRVDEARLHIVEFRGFERFIVGRPYWEVPATVQRLCGICPVSHQLAASKALDAVLGVDEPAPSANAIRRLMHYGQVLQSHALHFFYLASPDLLFGVDSERTREGILAVAREHPDVARQGVALRRFGQEVIRAATGKRIHGVGSIAGGVNRHVSREDRDALAGEADGVVASCEAAVALARAIHERSDGFFDRFAAVPARTMSLVGEGGALELYDGRLRVRGADGAVEADGVRGDAYLDLIEEEVRPWSYMKFPYLRRLGPVRGWYRVGPLARVHNCDRITTPLAERARREFVVRCAGLARHAPLASHWARMVEMLHAAEVVRALLGDALVVEGERTRRGARRREGIGVIEAPRGTLIHHYRVGDDDLVEDCNLVVSTTHNNQAMNEAIREVAASEFDGGEVTPAMLARVEIAIRAFDPCLSCATHALGRMPLVVEVVDATGATLASAVRDDPA